MSLKCSRSRRCLVRPCIWGSHWRSQEFFSEWILWRILWDESGVISSLPMCTQFFYTKRRTFIQSSKHVLVDNKFIIFVRNQVPTNWKLSYINNLFLLYVRYYICSVFIYYFNFKFSPFPLLRYPYYSLSWCSYSPATACKCSAVDWLDVMIHPSSGEKTVLVFSCGVFSLLKWKLHPAKTKLFLRYSCLEFGKRLTNTGSHHLFPAHPAPSTDFYCACLITIF